jgi:4-amino-4-deoxychorismate lyase
MTQATHLIINGHYKTSLHCVSILDRGLAYGDGVFETMYLSNRCIPLWQYHYERLQYGLKRLHISLDTQLLKDSLQKLLKYSDPDGVIKLIVTRGQGGRGYSPDGVDNPMISIMFLPVSTKLIEDNANKAEQGVNVHRCIQTLPECVALSGIKTLNQLPYVLASQEVRQADCDEGLLCNDDGFVIEATARNIFCVNNGEIYTPQLNKCGVAGVIRRLLMEKLASRLSLNIHERPITMNELVAANEVFLSNGVTHIWPVKAFGKTRWQPGPITRKIQQSVEDYIASDCSLGFMEQM